MSCSTLNSQIVRFTVSGGSLPEGFCPDNLQTLFNAFVTRLIISTNVNFTSFAIGSNEPTTNVGPWLKDCEVWYVWDDSVSRYRIMRFPQFNETVGAFRAFQVMPIDNAFTINTWVEFANVVTPKDNGGIVEVSAQGVVQYSPDDGPDQFALRVTDGTNEWPIVLDIPQSVATGNFFIPFSIKFTDSPSSTGLTTYRLQGSSSIAATMMASSTKGGKTVTGITRIDLVQFVIPT